MRRVKEWAILILGIILAVKLAVNVAYLVKTGEKLKEAEKQVAQAQAENEQLKRKLAQVQTPEFVEKEAREKLGLAQPGEEVVILPKVQNSTPSTTNKPVPNWKKWYDLYIGI